MHLRPLLILLAVAAWAHLAHCDTWITLWNKLDVPMRVHCMREGAKKASYTLWLNGNNY